MGCKNVKLLFLGGFSVALIYFIEMFKIKVVIYYIIKWFVDQRMVRKSGFCSCGAGDFIERRSQQIRFPQRTDQSFLMTRGDASYGR